MCSHHKWVSVACVSKTIITTFSICEVEKWVLLAVVGQVTEIGPKAMAWRRVQAGPGWGLIRKQFFTRRWWAWIRLPSGHGPELPEIKDHLDNAPRHRVRISGGAMWNQELDLILVNPFQLGAFYDSISEDGLFLCYLLAAYENLDILITFVLKIKKFLE